MAEDLGHCDFMQCKAYRILLVCLSSALLKLIHLPECYLRLLRCAIIIDSLRESSCLLRRALIPHQHSMDPRNPQAWWILRPACDWLLFEKVTKIAISARLNPADAMTKARHSNVLSNVLKTGRINHEISESCICFPIAS